jgi:thiamine-phosphate pyrophosphorylase
MAMATRQTVPRQWLVIADETTISSVWLLPRGSGVLLLERSSATSMRQLRHLARTRNLKIVRDGIEAARVHNSKELRRAMLQRKSLVLLSPLHRTASHPDWTPLPRMRAAALARLGRRKLFALGGMDSRKFARIRMLGFQGWAGISAFKT